MSWQCSQCGVCWDSFCPVPVKGEGGFPVIDVVKCQGCGFCAAICPTGTLSIELI